MSLDIIFQQQGKKDTFWHWIKGKKGKGARSLMASGQWGVRAASCLGHGM